MPLKKGKGKKIVSSNIKTEMAVASPRSNRSPSPSTRPGRARVRKRERAVAKASDVKGVIRRQRRYATLAEGEGRYALKKKTIEKKKREPEMAKDSDREARIAFAFSKARRRVADEETKKLKGKKDDSSE